LVFCPPLCVVTVFFGIGVYSVAVVVNWAATARKDFLPGEVVPLVLSLFFRTCFCSASHDDIFAGLFSFPRFQNYFCDPSGHHFVGFHRGDAGPTAGQARSQGISLLSSYPTSPTRALCPPGVRSGDSSWGTQAIFFVFNWSRFSLHIGFTRIGGLRSRCYFHGQLEHVLPCVHFSQVNLPGHYPFFITFVNPIPLFCLVSPLPRRRSVLFLFFSPVRCRFFDFLAGPRAD